MALVGVAGQKVLHLLVGAQCVLDAAGQGVTLVGLQQIERQDGGGGGGDVIESFPWFHFLYW